MSLTPLLLLVSLAVPLAAQAKAATTAPADPYVGSFTGEGGSIAVRKQGSTYTGIIIADGAENPYTARKIGRSLVGTFQAQGQGYLFSAAVQGDRMTFIANGETTILQQGRPSAARAGHGAPGGTPRGQAGATCATARPWGRPTPNGGCSPGMAA